PRADVRTDDRVEGRAIEPAREILGDLALGELGVVEADEVSPLGLSLPEATGNTCKEPQRSTSSLEIRDSREPFVQHPNKRWMERIRIFDLGDPARIAQVVWQLSPALSGGLNHLCVGLRHRPRGFSVDTLEETPSKDLRKVSLL